MTFAVGYGLVRFYWAAGGRWGYTACDRSHETADMSSGCAARQLSTLPFWQGWGAVALCCVLIAIAALATRSRSRAAAVGAWVACAALVVVSFPMHLLFQIPAALAGHPTDWRDLVNRLLLFGGGLLFGAAATAVRIRRCDHPRVEGRRPVPGWVRRWAYAGFAVPVVGWTVPHGLWLLGVPLGISAAGIDEVRDNLWQTAPAVTVAIVILPTLGGLLTLGLVRPWGQVLPAWLPLLAGRRVPRLLALIPAGVVAVSLISYGLISGWILIDGLRTGTTTWSQLRSGWAVAVTVPVFLAWGVALGVTAFGYYLVTRLRCGVCQPTTTRSLLSSREGRQ